ncbi:MAG: hypothetical protein M3T49_04540 [Candidatus Eremiobacteraeota bacterium]|nr:hypothetical protein [Candidatus Eremiobacteraeota bacterium]
MAILIALIAVVLNLWRLGPHYGPLAFSWLIGLFVLYLCTFPVLQLARAKPRPGRGAFVLASLYVAAFVYALIGFFTPLPASGLIVVLAVILMWAFFIIYRGVAFPSLFEPNGAFGARYRAVREAQRASKKLT